MGWLPHPAAEVWDLGAHTVTQPWHSVPALGTLPGGVFIWLVVPLAQEVTSWQDNLPVSLLDATHGGLGEEEELFI